jgi:hypothetical protein
MASQLAEQILMYLAKNPDAGDTIEGIVQWWLLEQRIENQVAETTRELRMLVDLGLVLEVESAEGRVYYRVNRRRQTEIREMLSRTKKQS